jgi:hypothetical protein
MEIHKVMESQLTIGNRIEGFTNKCYIFTDKKKAADFAYEKACNYNDETDNTNDVEYNKHGVYSWKDDHYEWDEYSLCIVTDTLNLKEDIINEVTFVD